MKGILYTILALLILYWLFTLIVPAVFEKGANKTSIAKPYQVSDHAKQLMTSIDFIADLHSDALLWDRDLTKASTYGHVDFKRMQEGQTVLQAFTIVTKSPRGQNFQENDANTFDNITLLSIGQGQPINTWFSLLNRALHQCKKLHKAARRFNDEFVVVKSKADFQELLSKRKTNKNVIGGFLGIEGGHCLEGKLENLNKLFDAGVRMLGPTHFFDNEMGGSAHGIHHGGLTDFGKEVIKEMEKKSMIMDVAHSSEAVIDDVLALYNGPIITSHTGVKGTYDSPRNLSDKHLQAIADKKGIIGIAFFAGATGGNTIADIVKAMRYTVDLIGIQHVALGSDFDGSVTTPFDITGLGLLIDEMIKQDFSEEEIKAIMGENVKRFLLQSLPNK